MSKDTKATSSQKPLLICISGTTTVLVVDAKGAEVSSIRLPIASSLFGGNLKNMVSKEAAANQPADFKQALTTHARQQFGITDSAVKLTTAQWDGAYAKYENAILSEKVLESDITDVTTIAGVLLGMEAQLNPETFAPPADGDYSSWVQLAEEVLNPTPAQEEAKPPVAEASKAAEQEAPGAGDNLPVIPSSNASSGVSTVNAQAILDNIRVQMNAQRAQTDAMNIVREQLAKAEAAAATSNEAMLGSIEILLRMAQDAGLQQPSEATTVTEPVKEAVVVEDDGL